jgi:hypothetical protein
VEDVADSMRLAKFPYGTEENMKARLLACVAAGLACAIPVAASAQNYGPDAARPYAGGAVAAVSPAQVAAGVRAAGLTPLSQPALRGAVYYMRATTRRNVEVRVAIDARTGQVLSATRVALDPPRPAGAPGTAPGAVPGPGPEAAAPRYEPYVRGSGYSEAAPVPPGDVPVEAQPLPSGRVLGLAPAAPPPARKVAAQPPMPRSRPGESAEVTGSVPETPAAKPALAPPTVANPPAAQPVTMVPIAPLE